MGLQTNRRNTHDSQFPITNHQTAQLREELHIQIERSKRLTEHLEDTLNHVKHIDQPNCHLTNDSASAFVQAMNNIRDAKAHMNFMFDLCSKCKRATRRAASIRDKSKALRAKLFS